MSLRIQFGSGGNILHGWVNTDIQYSDPALRVDIAKPLPWPDDSVTNVFMEHVLEHVSGPDALRCLDECYRILKLHGVLRICIPALSVEMVEKHRDLARDDVINHGHLIFVTEDSLRALLALAGFKSNMIILSPRKDCDGHHKVIGKERDDLETLRMEAIK